MGATVAELKQRMGAGEFVDWAVYSSLEPWGPAADDHAAALIGSLITAAWGKPVPMERLLRGRYPRPAQTVDQMRQTLLGMAAAVNAMEARKHDHNRKSGGEDHGRYDGARARR